MGLVGDMVKRYAGTPLTFVQLHDSMPIAVHREGKISQPLHLHAPLVERDIIIIPRDIAFVAQRRLFGNRIQIKHQRLNC